jgi:predicted DNA-binding protein (MmcQ/YjbR family)
MDANALRAACAAMPGTVEEFPFGPEAAVFKVGGRMFALVPVDSVPGRITLKCEPDLATELRRTYPAVVPGYHMNKRHWNTITCDGSIPEQLVREWIEDSYDLVVEGLPVSKRP